MRIALFLFALATLHAAERIDNVLQRLVPHDTVSLFGAQMDQVKSTPLYQKLIVEQKLGDLDAFATRTGFDPRRDVRELLVASDLAKKSGVLLARGNFHINQAVLQANKDVRRSQYRGYTFWTDTAQDNGFCIMDSTLAIAGPVVSMRAVLDQYKSTNTRQTSPLLQKALAVPIRNQVWLVSSGGADFLANNTPIDGAASNFVKIFRNLEGTLVEADLSRGLNARIFGACKTEADAKTLSDAARGLIGFGRLSVPDSQPQLLRVWDGIQVAQQGRSLTVNADLTPELIQQLLQLTQSAPRKPSDRSSFYSSEEESHRPKSKSPPH